jgi:hypothetical protein
LNRSRTKYEKLQRGKGRSSPRRCVFAHRYKKTYCCG